VALFLGIIVPLGLWSYAEIFVSGDKSTQGMLGTICALLFAPAGILILLLSFFKND
jgi:amino acid permease